MMRWIFGAAAVSLAMTCRPTYEFLVSRDLDGPVVVVFDDPNGVPATDVFRIPAEGTLFVRGPLEDGFLNVYLEDAPGERTRLDCEGPGVADRVCSNFLVASGNLNGCLDAAHAPFTLATFLVTTGRQGMLALQEEAVRRATMKSLENRGLREVAACYRERPHELDAYAR